MVASSDVAWKNSYGGVCKLWDYEGRLCDLKKAFCTFTGADETEVSSRSRPESIFPYRGGLSYLLLNGLKLSKSDSARQIREGYSPSSAYMAAASFGNFMETHNLESPKDSQELPYIQRNVCRTICGRDWSSVPKDELLLQYSEDSGVPIVGLMNKGQSATFSISRFGFFFLTRELLDMKVSDCIDFVGFSRSLVSKGVEKIKPLLEEYCKSHDLEIPQKKNYGEQLSFPF